MMRAGGDESGRLQQEDDCHARAWRTYSTVMEPLDLHGTWMLSWVGGVVTAEMERLKGVADRGAVEVAIGQPMEAWIRRRRSIIVWCA